MRESLHNSKLNQNHTDLKLEFRELVKSKLKQPTISEVTEDYIQKGLNIDSCKSTYSSSFDVQANKLSELKEYLTKSLGKSNYLYTQDGINSQIVIGHWRTKVDAFCLYNKATANGIKYLRDAIDDHGRVITLDDNSNHLFDTSGYWLGHLVTNEIIHKLEMLEIIANDYFSELYEFLYADDNRARVRGSRFKHLEFCLNFKSDIRSTSAFNKLVSKLSEMYDSTSICRTRKHSSLKSAKFELSKGLYLSIYFKAKDNLRIEYKLEDSYIKEFYKVEGYISLSQFVKVHQYNAINFFKTILLDECESSSRLKTSECEKELRSTIKEKYYTSLIRKITEGDGFFSVSSSDQSLYREVRRLLKLGIFVKENKQSKYSLHRRFSELINEDGITQRTFREF